MLAEERSTSISERCTRSRINSAIFVSSEGRGFDSIEFLRRHGSQSVLCRKAKSAENITDNGRRVSPVETPLALEEYSNFCGLFTEELATLAHRRRLRPAAAPPPATELLTGH